MLKKLRWRLTLICTLITTCILSAMSLFALNIFEKHYAMQLEETLENHLYTIIYRLKNEKYISQSYLQETETINNLIISIEDNGKPLLFNGNEHLIPITTRNYLINEAKHDATENYHFNLAPVYTSLIDVPQIIFEFQPDPQMHYNAALAVFSTSNGRCTVVLLHDLTEANAYIFKIRMTFALLTIGGILLLAIFSYWFARHAIIPIEKNIKKQNEFIAAASHELRSPLAIFETSVSALEYEENSSNAHFIKLLHKECNRMNRLVSDLLTIAHADSKKWTMQFESIEVPTMLIELYDIFYALCKEKGLQLDLLFPENKDIPLLIADEDRLKQVLTILIDNAITYTPEGGHITISVDVDTSHLHLYVIDNGIGIDHVHKAHIFDRFYRIDPSRHKKEHYGLGLSIAKEIIKLHHGKIIVTDTPGGGATFSICIPIHMKS